MDIPRLRNPVVLVHGLLGFDRLNLRGWKVVDYFPGIPEMLRAAGNRVHVACLSPTAGVADRAAELKAFVERELPGGESFHLIAHSMGGLDSRYMVSRLGLERRALSLTTLGTPHRGTAFADWGIRNIERALKPFFDFFSVPLQAFHDLTTEACARMNETVKDSAHVRYFSVAGRFERTHPLSGEWLMSHGILNEAEGPNDGLVSVQSATWGEVSEIWEGDHVGLINWPNPLLLAKGLWKDRREKYVELIRNLQEQGF